MSSTDALEKLCEANSSFLSVLYKIILKDTADCNIFFSPFSISLALSMTMVGAQGNTLKQMKKALFYENMEDSQLHPSFKALLNQLTSPTSKSQPGSVSIANGLFIQNNFQLLQSFVNTVQEMYTAVSKNVDFEKNPEDAKSQVNNWVKDATREKISNLLDDVDPQTVLIIINAIYFKALWTHKFDPSLTKLSQFSVNDNDKVQVKMMCLSEDFRHTVNEAADCNVLELPYQDGKTSMIIFLPRQINGLSKIEALMSQDFIKESVSNLNPPWPVELELPSFKLEQSYSLAPVLKSMGMTDLFVPDTANLKGISQGQELFVSEVIHKSVVEVNEEGTEAAAATAVQITLCCYKKPIRYIVDHPFLFAIIDNLYNVLFIGSLKKPQPV